MSKTVRSEGEIMGIAIIQRSGLRMREHRKVNNLNRSLGLTSIPSGKLNQRKKKLNKSNFKSEVWFQNILRDSFLNYSFIVFKNHPVANMYFCDFLIDEFSIGIEVDGASHRNSKDYDLRRDEVFKLHGISVFRVTAYDDDSAAKAIALIKNKIDEMLIEKTFKKDYFKTLFPRDKSKVNHFLSLSFDCKSDTQQPRLNKLQDGPREIETHSI